MRSVKARYKKIEKENPGLSTIMVFAGTIKNQGYDRRTVQRWFDELVDSGDYTRSQKTPILEQFYTLSTKE